jgi:hypothetical protein
VNRLPDLSQSLQGRDLGHLRIVAELWGLELNVADTRSALSGLTTALLDSAVVDEGMELLPVEAHTALDELLRNKGRMPWAQFTRRFGVVREMGAGRRDREKPHLEPASAAEMLWYRALVARAFFETDTGAEEYAFIPKDLIPLLPIPGGKAPTLLGRPATSIERAHLIPATDHILDDACTLLAALRTFGPSAVPQLACSPAPLLSLLSSAGLLDSAGLPLSEPTRLFLEAPRGEALAILARAWLNSETFNELRQLPGLECEGEWKNDPLRTRRAILEFLGTVPADSWWSINAFIAAIKQRSPDFQRPAGDYDSWFIRDAQSGGGTVVPKYLRGFAHWDQVDGALIRYLICAPLHWLGIFDLAAPSPAETAASFRWSGWSVALLQGAAPADLPPENGMLQLSSDARLRAPHLTPRAVRYQVARFCEWDKEDAEGYRYRLTPSSLEGARQQGLRVAHLLALLRRHATVVPPSLVKALERWEERGAAARLEQLWVLRLSSTELLQELRASRAARFLGDPLGPTTILVKPAAVEKVLAILAEMGYLGELISSRSPQDHPEGG